MRRSLGSRQELLSNRLNSSNKKISEGPSVKALQWKVSRWIAEPSPGWDSGYCPSLNENLHICEQRSMLNIAQIKLGYLKGMFRILILLNSNFWISILSAQYAYKFIYEQRRVSERLSVKDKPLEIQVEYRRAVYRLFFPCGSSWYRSIWGQEKFLLIVFYKVHISHTRYLKDIWDLL